MKTINRASFDSILSDFSIKYSEISFVESDWFSWSPRKKIINYKKESTYNQFSIWSLIHELAHALLEHSKYYFDIDLISIEMEAWKKAESIALKYAITIDKNYIEDCLDTYRDWQYKRSLCPICNNSGLQQNMSTYKCINCKSTWKVTSSKLCRPYRSLSSSLKDTG